MFVTQIWRWWWLTAQQAQQCYEFSLDVHVIRLQQNPSIKRITSTMPCCFICEMDAILWSQLSSISTLICHNSVAAAAVAVVVFVVVCKWINNYSYVSDVEMPFKTFIFDNEVKIIPFFLFTCIIKKVCSKCSLSKCWYLCDKACFKSIAKWTPLRDLH